MESEDKPKAHQDQLDFHTAQGSEDLPLQSYAPIERNLPVEELVSRKLELHKRDEYAILALCQQRYYRN
jgi:hypothetical protein